jgi:hypothetical protein
MLRSFGVAFFMFVNSYVSLKAGIATPLKVLFNLYGENRWLMLIRVRSSFDRG